MDRQMIFFVLVTFICNKKSDRYNARSKLSTTFTNTITFTSTTGCRVFFSSSFFWTPFLSYFMYDLSFTKGQRYKSRIFSQILSMMFDFTRDISERQGRDRFTQAVLRKPLQRVCTPSTCLSHCALLSLAILRSSRMAQSLFLASWVLPGQT